MMKEIRNTLDLSKSEGRTIEGYSIVFNSLSNDLGGFKEIISPSAITDETIRKSDILFLLDHNKDRGVLARSKNGEGSLRISIDERGVKYTFDAPHTSLGDEILEGVRRGDLSKCSFAFVVGDDRWMKQEDGTVLRTIDSIKQLYDFSLVYTPAYEETIVVNKRGLEELMENEIRNDSEKDDVKENEPEKVDESSENQDEPSKEEPKEDEKEKTSEDESDDSKEDETRNSDNNLYNKIENSHNIMNKKFSLINTINDTINRRSNEFVHDNTISLPLETRAEGDTETPTAVVPNGIMATEATMGKETMPTELWSLMTDLKDKLVLNQLGAQIISANGTIEIPTYNSSVAGWASEIEHAKDVAGKFGSIKLSGLRLSAFMDISKSWLNQTSASAETILRNELVNCIVLKLQQTIFSNGKGVDGIEPQGIFYGVTADTKAVTYDDIIAMEEQLEEANVYGDFKYVVSPSAKAQMRTLKRDAGSGLFVWENNQIEGVDALSTNSVIQKGMVLGDWSNFILAFFGGNVDLTVDTVSRAVYNQVRLVVTVDVNYLMKRPEAFIRRILK